MPLVAVPTLTDGIVTLRGHTDEDVLGSWEQCQDPLSQAWTTVPVPYSLDDARHFVREVMPGGWASDQEWGFAIEAADADGVPRYAGTVSLRAEGEGRAEIAYGSHPWVRGTGHVERALRLLLDWGFAPVEEGGRGLHTVIWWAQVGNWPSRRVAWRLGFTCDGPVREWLPQRGQMLDAWVGSLLSTDEREPRGPWLDVPEITGDGLLLRPHREEDIARVLEACQDERTSYWLGGMPSPYTQADAEAFVRSRPESMARGTAVHWAIAEPGTDLLLGSISLMDIGSQSGTEIGYWAHPDARGRGLMTEAVRRVARHAFIDEADGGLGMTKVRLLSAADNAASRQVADANGFRLAGVEREGTICRDGRHDAAIYDLLAGDISR